MIIDVRRKTKKVPTLNISVENIFEAQQGLLDLHDTIASFINNYGFEPLPESIGGRELAENSYKDLLKTAYSQGHFLFESTADHVYSLIKLLDGKVPTLSPYTCLRAGLESAALSCWLLCTEIDAHMRISRCMAFRYEGLLQQLKVARGINDGANVAGIKKRITDVEQEATQLGFRAKYNKKNKIIWITEQFPSATECIEGEFGEEVLFRILSAVAHGRTWATQQVGFTAPDNDNPTILQKNLSKSGALLLLSTSAEILTRTAWIRSKLLGHDLEKFTALVNESFIKMGLNGNQASWCSNDTF